MALGRLFAQMPDVKKASEACKMALNITNRKSKIDSMSEEGLRPDKVVGEIRFTNVYFKYPNRPNLKILNGLNLYVNTGESNALVGQSGCGKSTTIGILLFLSSFNSLSSIKQF
jgi:ATP-binding cassette subfamily B (MDR/TAP) protein 1